MKKVNLLYLSQEDVVGAGLGLGRVMEVVEEALASHGHSMVEMPPKPGIHPRQSSFIHAMPVWIKDKDLCGIKWVSGYPGNKSYDLPQIAGLLILNNPETGMPLCVMDCRWITAVRTAAVTAITAKHTAVRNARTLTVIGTGVQGRFNSVMLKIAVPTLETILAYDLNEASLQRYLKEMADYGGAEARAAASIEAAVKNADIVLTATQRLDKPLIPLEWLKPGVCGFGLEASRAWCGDAILGVDKFITDDWEQTKYFAQYGAFADGLPKLHAELSEIVIGKKPGRENQQERILAINLGMAVEDIAVAQEVYQRAIASGKGTELTLMGEDLSAG